MMRPLALMAAGTALFATAAAHAQELNVASGQVEILGDAPAACVLGQPSVSNAVNASFSQSGLASGTVNIAEFVNLQTAETQASSIELVFPIVCNASHSVTLHSENGGMLRLGAAPAAAEGGGQGFGEFVTYQLRMDWAGQQRDQSSDLGDALISAAEPRKGDLSLQVSTPAGAGPLVAGQYNDEIVIEFQLAM